jgi:hypothetical protein
MQREFHLVRMVPSDGAFVEQNVQSFDTRELAINGAERFHESEVYSSQPSRSPVYRYIVRHMGLVVWDSEVATPREMPRSQRMIEIVMKSLREAAASAEWKRSHRLNETDPDRERNARITLANAVDEALADLEHALSQHPCNHGACLHTTLNDGSYAHTDMRAKRPHNEWCKDPNCDHGKIGHKH